jgi:hypothetical protein
MRGGGQRRGNPCREALGQRHVLRAVRPAGVRVAKAQRAKHLVINHDRDDEGGRRGQPALQRGRGAAAHAVVVCVNTGTERRLARSHDERGGAGKVVAPDGTGTDHRAHVAGELAGAMTGGDAAKRPRRGDMDEVEVGEARKRGARGESGAAVGRRRRPPESSRR